MMSSNYSLLQGFLICLAFFFAGIVDSISGGGGLITIPSMLAVGIPVHFITGTNQCSAWIGSGVAAFKYLKGGKIHLKSALITLPFAIAGSFCGAKLNLMVSDYALKLFMLITVPVISVFVLINRKLGAESHIEEQSDRLIILWSAVIGILLGAYQGFYGPGCGLFFMLSYAAFLKMDLVSATGNTRLVVAIASFASVLTYMFSGAVLWKLAIAATFFNIIGSYIGASLAIRNGAKIIRPLMFFVVLLLLAKLIIDL